MRQCAFVELVQFVAGQRFEGIDLRAREQCGIDRQPRMLGRPPHQGQEPRLDMGQQGILLRLVEAVTKALDFVMK
ncbi:hypothetical protein HpMS107_39490 [Helicobacter pylori]